MSFIWPTMLVLLVLIPLFVLLYALAQRRRRRLVARYGSFGIVQSASGRGVGKRRHIPPAFFLTGLTILLISIARPEAAVSLPRLEGIVILAFDVSRSMGADDVEPTRLEMAKTAAQAFVAKQPSSVQIGVVAFSDSGLAVQSPTSNREAILAAIQRLQPQLGTSLGQGILSALKTIAVASGEDIESLARENQAPMPETPPSQQERATPAVIVLFSDGDNNSDPDPLDVAQTAAERGVQIYTVGLGSPTGADLEVEGFTVHTQLNEETLQQIAQQTDGTYFNVTRLEDLQAIYNSVETQLVVKPEKTEITALFAGVGLLLLLVGSIGSLLWLSRVP